MKTKIVSILCVVCLLVGCLSALSSCNPSEQASVISAEINENGELVLGYSDGTTQSLGVVGAGGEAGENGEDGENGENGQDGKDGKDGKDGSLVIVSDGSSIPSATAKGLRSAVSIVCKFKATV